MLKKYSEQTVGIIGLLGLVVGLGLLFISAFITSVFFILGGWLPCIVLVEGLCDSSYSAFTKKHRTATGKCQICRVYISISSAWSSRNL